MRAALVLAAALLLLPSAALAQREQRGAAPGSFDFYVLSLSWSATFCALEGDRRGSRQCDAGRGYDFVVHGLWPQYTRGYPAFCSPEERSPTRDAMEIARAVYPEDGLARHQWRKHGTCTGLSPSAYFRLAGEARGRIRLPDAYSGRDARPRASPAEVESAFIAANPGLRPDSIAVTCDRGLLEEVRICLARDLRSFASCPEVDRSGCRAGTVTVPAAR